MEMALQLARELPLGRELQLGRELARIGRGSSQCRVLVLVLAPIVGSSTQCQEPSLAPIVGSSSQCQEPWLARIFGSSRQSQEPAPELALALGCC